MGCDIHAVVEKKVGPKWICVNTLTHCSPAYQIREQFSYVWPAAIARNYKRFSLLAGVRGEGPAPRGLPDDLSETGRYLVEECDQDGHSHSWLSLAEAAKIFLATEPLTPNDNKDWICEYPTDFFFSVSKNVEDYRLVFWFDN